MRRIPLLLALPFLLSPGLAPAQQVFKCVDKNGKVKFSQSRCNDEPPAPPKPAGPEPPVPARVEKVSPYERERPATEPGVREEPQPMVDDHGRASTTEMIKQYEKQKQEPPAAK